MASFFCDCAELLVMVREPLLLVEDELIDCLVQYLLLYLLCSNLFVCFHDLGLDFFAVEPTDLGIIVLLVHERIKTLV